MKTLEKNDKIKKNNDGNNFIYVPFLCFGISDVLEIARQDNDNDDKISIHHPSSWNNKK